MSWKLFSLCVIVVYCVTVMSATPDTVVKTIEISKVQRTVDLTSHLPHISSSITFENKGSASVQTLFLAVDPNLQSKLSFISALVKTSDEDVKLHVTKAAISGSKNQLYRAELAEPLAAGKDITIDVSTYYSHALEPYPFEIKQSEKQYVRFAGNAYLYSPYKIASQSTTVKLATSTVESYTKTPKPVSKNEAEVTYGPYEDTEPFATSDFEVHYENNRPFIAVADMTRVIEISHWGNLAVEETLDIRHTGALLKGPFSRYEYQRNQDGYASVKSFTTLLPASARDVYYRDEIGNISTSNLREGDEHMEMEIRPRFPLFGGWKTHYYIGYNVPSYQYLYNKGDKFILKMRFVDHVFDDQVVDHINLRVILPEGSKDIKLVAPYDVERSPDELHFTYLDTVGRPVVIASKSDLTEGHIQDFELHYTFNRLSMLQEPLLVVGFFFLLFLTAIIYVRLDFSLTKDEASESRMRVASLIDQIQEVQDRRSALYQSYDDAINKFKANKDLNKFHSNKKTVDVNHKHLTQQITAMQGQLKSEGSDMTEKVGELQKLDQQVKEQITLLVTYSEKLVAGKMNKTAYLDTEKAVQSKKDDLCQKMEVMLSSF